jgi:uncharacterized protein
MQMQPNNPIDLTRHWLQEVVIGLNLCPFASKPFNENRVRFAVSSATDDEQLLKELEDEMNLLDADTQVETTLLIIPNDLKDFFDYTQFLVWANQLIKRNHWKGVYQLASFHPEYCFAGAAPDDSANLTNRSPFPMLHIIREASLAKALEFFPDVDQVPERNKEKMFDLSEEQKRQLFFYLFKPV